MWALAFPSSHLSPDFLDALQVFAGMQNREHLGMRSHKFERGRVSPSRRSKANYCGERLPPVGCISITATIKSVE